MSERPILFSAPMVRALLDGRKAQTRRVAKEFDGLDVDGILKRFPHQKGGPYEVGQTLWVREAWTEVPWVHADGEKDTQVLYRADAPGKNVFDPERGDRWRPSIHMPRWASRITLRVTNVRVEKLQDISPEDAEAEGVFRHIARHSIDKVFRDERGATAIARFRELWDSINAKRAPWKSNPWVWVVTFEVVA